MTEMNSDGKQAPKLDDLLREIKKLSTKMKEGKSDDSTSSKEGTVTSQPTSGKKIPRKRQKTRHKKQRGRKRQLKNANLDIDSSSFTDCTDEDIIRDYIENITANLSDSDVDSTLKKRPFLVSGDFSSNHDFHIPWSPEVDETDSFSESLLLNKTHKKCRRYKRHSVEQLENQLNNVPADQQDRLQVISYKFQRPRYVILKSKKVRIDKTDGDEEMEGIEDGVIELLSLDSSQTTSSTDNSESSSNSHSPGSEADDEGEESCVESSIAKQSPFSWENGYDSDSMAFLQNDQMDGVIEQSLNLKTGRQDIKTRQRTPTTVLCESGGFVAYANHKIKLFVHQRDPNELSLYTTSKKEQDQVLQLATLYNLNCLLEEAARSNKVVLTKNINTKDPDQESLKVFLYKEIKLRCRKKQLPPQWNSKRRKIGYLADVQTMDVSVPDNVNNSISRNIARSSCHNLSKDTNNMNLVRHGRRTKSLSLGQSASK